MNLPPCSGGRRAGFSRAGGLVSGTQPPTRLPLRGSLTTPLSGDRHEFPRRSSTIRLGEALGGMILLSVAGSLPELDITISAAVAGNLGMAAGNLIGGVAM